jgi:hypothetical protein
VWGGERGEREREGFRLDEWRSDGVKGKYENVGLDFLCFSVKV